MPTSEIGTMLSGNTYVSAKMRDDSASRRNIVALLIRKPINCDHGRYGPTICTRCAESWSWDYDLMFWRTIGGRNFATSMGLVPETAGETLRYRDGYERRSP